MTLRESGNLQILKNDIERPPVARRFKAIAI
jgi:hypothetical protein